MQPDIHIGNQLPKSLNRSCAGYFYGTEIEIWAGFGPVLGRLAILTKIGANYEQLWKAFFSFNSIFLNIAL